MPPPPPSSPAAPRRLEPLMPHSSTEPQGAAADPSTSRGTEGTPAPSANTGSAPEDSPPPGDGVDDFVLDSGATAHVTARGDLLSDPRPPDEGTVVRTRVGADLPVAAVGFVRRPRFAVPQVHHVPALKNGSTTVISVRQLARRGLAVTFGAESCSVKDPSNGALVGEGRLSEEDGFYHLHYLRVRRALKAEAFLGFRKKKARKKEKKPRNCSGAHLPKPSCSYVCAIQEQRLRWRSSSF